MIFRVHVQLCLLLGLKYFVTFVDDFSRVTWLYLMKSLSKLLFFLL